MILRRLARVNRNQRGFSLIELVIALAIAALVGGGAVMATFSVITTNSGSTTHMTAVKEVENAVHWLTRDAQMAQFEEDEPPTGPWAFNDPIHPLVLTWVNDYDGISGNVTYQQNGGQLLRVYSGSEGSATTVVAQHIDFNSLNTNWSFSGGYNGSVLSFKIKASVGGFRPSSETRLFDVVTRSVP